MVFTYLNKSGLSYLINKVRSIISQTENDMQDSIDNLSDRIDTLDVNVEGFADGLDWKQSVDTFEDIAITYPNPEDGWVVNVIDTNYTYMYDGTNWIPISANAIPNATTSVNGIMTTTQVTKLNGLYNYDLPIAGTAELGGIKSDNDTILIDSDGVASVIIDDLELSDMSDANIVNPLDGQTLMFDELQNKWVNRNSGTKPELDDVSGANAIIDSSLKTATIIWTDPSDVTESGVTFVRWAGTKLVRKIGSAPEDETDGVLLANSTIRNQYSSTGYVDENLRFDRIYYYRFFPYSDEGIVTSGTTLNCELEKTSVPIPEQNGSLTYNGGEQSPVLTTYTGFTISGTQSAINAGTYTLTATLETGYKWSDNTTEAKLVSWVIGKASSNVIATPSSVQLDLTHLTNTTVLSNLLGRTVNSVISDDETIATVSFNSTNNTITMSHVNQTSGNTTITVITSDSNNYNSSTIEIEVVASFISTTLNENSWEVINQAAIDGTASSYWNVGDRKIIEMQSGTVGYINPQGSYCVYILGFNHNATYTGGQDIHFQFGFSSLNNNGIHIGLYDSYYNSSVNAINTGFAMSTWWSYSGQKWDSTNVYGWRGCKLRKDIIPQFKMLLPEELKAVLSRKNIYTNNKSGYNVSATDITSSYDDVFLLSEYEILGETIHSSEYESDKQLQYNYYLNGNDKIIYKYDQTNAAINYNLRSPSTTNAISSNSFCNIRDDGSSTYQITSSMSEGFAPAFIVGKLNYSEVPSWSTATDAQIVEAIAAHYNGEINLFNCWNIGDERTISLSGNDITENIVMVLANCGGKLTSDNKECIFMVCQKDCLSSLRKMNASSGVYGGWSQTELRTWLNSNYRNCFPNTIVDIFKQHTNQYNNQLQSNRGKNNNTTDYFALCTRKELFGTSYSYDYTDSNYNGQFELYYRNPLMTNKKQGINGSENITYWTRECVDVSSGGASSFVTNDGTATVTGNRGIAPFGVI